MLVVLDLKTKTVMQRWSILKWILFLLIGVFQPAGAAPVCPSQDFDRFFEVFSESTAIQKAFTRYPLKYGSVDFEREDYNKLYFKNLAAPDINFPIFQQKAERKRENLQFTIESPSRDKRKVTLQKGETCYVVEFYFLRGKCWQLTEVQDWSL